MRRRVVWVLSVLALSAPWSWAAAPGPTAGPRAVVGDPRGRPVPANELDARTREVAALLRCPVCQGLSVADSPASMALSMKDEVREMLAAGYDQEQILAYFERSYGQFVRLKPPLRGVNWLVWLAPVVALALGLGLVSWALRTGRGSDTPAGEEASVPGHDSLPGDPELAAYVLRARELAYGWPEGRRPDPEETH
jgi:cytochrome c-type biogenesis protein CcmH